ncbi:MAG TPA: EAL domain-containing protein [Xanthobacteraceae bacterium]
MSNRDRNTTFRSLMGLAVGIIMLAVGATALTIWSLRSDAVDDATRDADNIATVLAEQTARSVQAIDIVLSDLHERLLALGATTPEQFRELAGNQQIHDLLIDRLARLPQATVITLIDSDGRFWNTTRSWPPPTISLAESETFLRTRNSRDKSLLIGAPVRNRTDGKWAIYLARRIEAPSGEFLGTIQAGVEIQYFNEIYASIQSLRNQSFMLLRDDGTVLVRHPGGEEHAGKKMPIGLPWYAVLSRGGGHYRSAGDFDSEARLVAVRPLRDYPLVVNVGTSEAAALANWHRRAGFIGAGSLLMVVCSAFLLAALTRQFKRLMQSEAALVEREATLAQKSRELESANIHIDGALNNIPQGVCMFDREARIVVVNERYIQMYGLSREVVKPGCSLRTLIYHRKDVGLFKGDPDQYCKDIIDTISQGKTSSLLIETTDGRSIYIVQQPMANGGWVVTHDDVTERRRAEEQMAFMARHDALTGLANRVLLLEKMEEALARLRRRGEVFTVFMFDLDLFKAVNDSLGHPVGDALLKAVAHRLRAGTRETDMVARLGGDEFALLQSVEGNQREGAIILANRLLEEISAPYEIDGHQIVIGTSIGIVLAPSDGTEADQLLKNADLALYRAKSEGRHGYRLFDPAMDAEARARRALQVDLRNAIARDEFELYYQTVFEARTGNVCGAEALVRWCHPQHGVIEPNQFIHLAEEVGLIAPLGEWILRKACTEAARWPSGIKLAVNLSPAQFRKCNLVDIVADALVASGLPPDRLEVEITESLLLQKNAGNLSMLHELKSLGISIVLDDFGTGYSSFSYLRMFPFDKIKIDRSFVSELSVRADCAAIVCAVVGLGRGLNIVTTAEGVETAEQLALLRAAGVDQVQGFLFSRPCPATELALLGFHVRARNGKAA